MHLSSVIHANDTRESVFGHQNFPRSKRGSKLRPLASEASALTTELPRFQQRTKQTTKQTTKKTIFVVTYGLRINSCEMNCKRTLDMVWRSNIWSSGLDKSDKSDPGLWNSFTYYKGLQVWHYTDIKLQFYLLKKMSIIVSCILPDQGLWLVPWRMCLDLCILWSYRLSQLLQIQINLQYHPCRQVQGVWNVQYMRLVTRYSEIDNLQYLQPNRLHSCRD